MRAFVYTCPAGPLTCTKRNKPAVKGPGPDLGGPGGHGPAGPHHRGPHHESMSYWLAQFVDLLCDPLLQWTINDDPSSLLAPGPHQQNPALQRPVYRLLHHCVMVAWCADTYWRLKSWEVLIRRRDNRLSVFLITDLTGHVPDQLYTSLMSRRSAAVFYATN